MNSQSPLTKSSRQAITAANRQTLDQMFHNPISRQVAGDAVAALIANVGRVEERSNDHVVFKIGHRVYEVHKPHTDYLTAPKIQGVRRFLAACGRSPRSHVDGSASAQA